LENNEKIHIAMAEDSVIKRIIRGVVIWKESLKLFDMSFVNGKESRIEKTITRGRYFNLRMPDEKECPIIIGNSLRLSHSPVTITMIKTSIIISLS